MALSIAVGRITATAFICVLVLAAGGAPVGTAVADTPETTHTRTSTIVVDDQESVFAQQNNSTVQHQNPDSVDSKGNVSSVRRWLSGRLTRTMINCTNGLNVGQFDACDRFENKSPGWLDNYVEVSRDTDSSSGDSDGANGSGSTNTSKSFERAQRNQTQLASTVRAYNRTLTEYEQARAQGNTRRARNLSRQLLTLSEQTRNVSSNFTQNLRTIENRTGQNTTGAVRTVARTRDNLTTSVETISAEQFVNTTLTANASPRRISFRRPLSVSGRLTLENGTPIAGQTVVLRAGNDSRRVQTNASGGFSLRYRPTSLSLDRESVMIEYIPEDLSPYRSDETSAPVIVTQTEPQATVTANPNEVSANENLTVAGRINAGGQGVSTVPIIASIDGQRLGRWPTAITTTKGRFRVTTTLPTDIPAGEQSLRVSIPFENRAIANTTATAPVTIEPTATTLSVRAPSTRVVNRSDTDANATVGRSIPVSGRLMTTNSTPISNRSVAIRIDGTTVSEVRTDTNGSYTTNATIPPRLLAGDGESVSATVAAVYDGHGTSFARSRAETTTEITPPADGLAQQFVAAFSALPISHRVLLGVSGLFVGIVLMHPFGRRLRSKSVDWTVNRAPSPTEQENASSWQPTTDGSADISLLGVAYKRLMTGDSEGAIITAYLSVRKRLSEAFRTTSMQTHGEFLAAYRERAGDTIPFAALSRLTDAYERAAFAPQTSSNESANEALVDAQEVVDDPTVRDQSKIENTDMDPSAAVNESDANES